jgi:hypothetical protein
MGDLVADITGHDIKSSPPFEAHSIQQEGIDD